MKHLPQQQLRDFIFSKQSVQRYTEATEGRQMNMTTKLSYQQMNRLQKCAVSELLSVKVLI